MKRLILIAFLLFAAFQLRAEEPSKAFMRENKNGNIVYIGKESSSPRSRSTFSTERIIENNKLMYKYTAYGKGDYDEYKDVAFDIEAKMEEKNGLLYPVYSFTSIKNKDGGLIARREKNFDYAKQKIYYTISDSKEVVIKNITFPMKGLTVDGPTMIHFLKAFVARLGEDSYKTFYLISDKGQLYKINIKDMGLETLEISGEKIKAKKLRLIPELGLLTGIAKSLIPPTFIWYSEKEPYDWLQYEGLETGIGSAYIIISNLTP